MKNHIPYKCITYLSLSLLRSLSSLSLLLSSLFFKASCILSCSSYKQEGESTKSLCEKNIPNDFIQFTSHHACERTHHSLFYLLLFLFEELPWYPADRVLCRQQQLPQVWHEQASVLAVQEPCQVNLHLLGIWVLLLNTQVGREQTFNPLANLQYVTVLKNIALRYFLTYITNFTFILNVLVTNHAVHLSLLSKNDLTSLPPQHILRNWFSSCR